MKKKEVQIEIHRRLAQGESKSSVFQMLSGKGIKDRVVAHIIASYADPKLCVRHVKLIKIIVAIAWIELVVGILVSIVLSAKLGLILTLLITAFAGAFCYLFVWGFTNNKAWAYNVSILLSITNIPKSLSGFSETPVANTLILIINVAVLAFTWYLRDKIFPDFLFVTPRKVNGTYIFSN
ncbi:MAG: hypothetical protein ABFD81_06930 [Syntrophaceae bacterium]